MISKDKNYREKHVWEGWTVGDFIDELEPELDLIYRSDWYYRFQTRKELKTWVMDNQPYYKKYIPEVVNYFADRYKL